MDDREWGLLQKKKNTACVTAVVLMQMLHWILIKEVIVLWPQALIIYKYEKMIDNRSSSSIKKYVIAIWMFDT